MGTKSTGAMCVAMALGLLALTGCDAIDPLKRPYIWREGDVNTKNIAAMAANPADLERGRESPRRSAEADADGAERYRTGKLKPLLAGGGGSAGGVSSGGDSGGGAPASGGGS